MAIPHCGSKIPVLLLTRHLLLVLLFALAACTSGSHPTDRPLDSGGVFHVNPVQPVAQLLPIALASTPASESGDFRPADLVELTVLEPTIKLDIRYATSRNFLDTPLYSQPRAFMQRPAAEALVRCTDPSRRRVTVFWCTTPTGRGT